MIESAEERMKRDGRTLDHKTLEDIRRMAVQRVREGEKPSAVIASFGFCRPVIYKWLKTAAGRGRGLRALHSTRGTGRPRSLTPVQERQVFRWINGRDPRQYGLDFGLWTRRIVALLIKRKFGIGLGITAVGALPPNRPPRRSMCAGPSLLWISGAHLPCPVSGAGPARAGGARAAADRRRGVRGAARCRTWLRPRHLRAAGGDVPAGRCAGRATVAACGLRSGGASGGRPQYRPNNLTTGCSGP